jgi:hypothetical protein
MIILNGKKFAESEEEFTSSLFETGGTCVGYAKRFKRKIDLFDHNNKLIGGINKWGTLYTANKLITGETYYHAWPPTVIGKDYQFSELDRITRDLAVGHDWNTKNEYQLIFKL